MLARVCILPYLIWLFLFEKIFLNVFQKILFQIISKCVKTCLLLASKYTSIVFTALGTGKLNYPRNLVAEVMYKSVRRFQPANSSLKEVRFLCYDAETIQVSVFYICVTNDHGYVPLVSTSRSFPHPCLIIGLVTRLTRPVSLVEQELITLRST